MAHLKKKVNLQIEGPLLSEEEYERRYSEESVKFLKRKYTYQDYELRIASDSKYSKKLTEILKLEKKKPKNSPCTPSCQEKDLSQELREGDAGTYRSCVGILLYVVHDRPDIQFAVRNLSTAMSKPTERKKKELEHLALYLKGTYDYNVAYTRTTPGRSALHKKQPEEEPQVPQPEEHEHLLEVFSDSDWAGDKQTRKSVSCAMFYLDGAYFYSYSRTQKSIALSSAEAEYMALTGAASEGIGLHAAARFLTGKRVQLKAYTDSSACRGITNRQGAGRVKHLQIRLLWLQAAIREGRLTVHSVGTKENTADLGTKPLSTRRVRYLLNMIGMCSSEGRVGEQERAEEDKAQVVRRLEKIMKNKSSMLFALSSLLVQQSEAMFVPFAAAQGPSPQEAAQVPQFSGSMSFLEMVVAILMAGLAIYFVVNLEKKSKKREAEERRRKNQKPSSSEEEESSESDKSEEKKKKKTRRRRRTESEEEDSKKKSEAPAAQVSSDDDLTTDKAKKEEERKKLEEEKQALRKEKESFEEKVKQLSEKEKAAKERDEQARGAYKAARIREDKYKELESTLNDRESALAAKEKEVAQKEKEVLKREKEAEKTERKAQERTVDYDTERENYAKKYVDEAKRELEKELETLKRQEKERIQKLDDLEYDYKYIKDDMVYWKDYSREVDQAMVNAKEKIRRQRKKIKDLKETMGLTLSGSEGEADEPENPPAEDPPTEESKPAEVQQEAEEKKEVKPAAKKRPKNIESPGTVDENPDVNEFVCLGWVWEFNKKTQEYRAAREDKKGSQRINNAPIKGRQLWNKVCETYRNHGVWFSDGGDMDAYLQSKDNQRIEEEVNRRLGEKGSQGNKGGKNKGGDNKGKGHQQSENWNDDGSWWWSQDDSWNYSDAGWNESNWYNDDQQWNQQWTPKGKSKGKGGKPYQ